MTDRIKIKFWWSEDKQWFCILTDDGNNQSTVSLTVEEASLLSMNAAHPQPQQADGRQQDETTVLPAETIAYWFMDNHPGLDLLHADITDLIDRARIDGARQQSEGRGTVAGCAHQRGCPQAVTRPDGNTP